MRRIGARWNPPSGSWSLAIGPLAAAVGTFQDEESRAGALDWHEPLPYDRHMTRTQTMVQLTSELVASLDEEARRSGVSRSAIIRDAVEEYLASSRHADLSARLLAGYSRIPQGAIDEWGDTVGQLRDGTARTLRRLDDEEEAAGKSW